MSIITLYSFLVLIMSVVIHELAHAGVAFTLGDDTAKRAGRITLNPIKHLDLLGSVIVPLITSLTGTSFGWAKPVPVDPTKLKYGRKGEVLVALAGPLSNFILALIFILFLKISYQDYHHIHISHASIALMLQIILVNIVLAIFNMMPIPPLDGSKVLFGLLPTRLFWFERWCQSNQIWLFLLFVFFLWKFFSPIIGFLIRFLV